MACKHFLRPAIIALIVLFHTAGAYSTEIYNFSPLYGMEWTFETTKGFQNMVMSVEGGSNSYTKTLDFSGILFHTYIDDVPLVKAQFNFGFSNRPLFLWSDTPDFNSDTNLNEHLLCTEVDAQFHIPVYFGSSSFYPFIGFMFFSYNESSVDNSDYLTDYTYKTLSVGIQHHKPITRAISHDYYLSFTPAESYNTQFSMPTFINIGSEVKINASPVAVTLFMAMRCWDDFATLDIGISSHMNIR